MDGQPGPPSCRAEDDDVFGPATALAQDKSRHHRSKEPEDCPAEDVVTHRPPPIVECHRAPQRPPSSGCIAPPMAGAAHSDRRIPSVFPKSVTQSVEDDAHGRGTYGFAAIGVPMD